MLVQRLSPSEQAQAGVYFGLCRCRQLAGTSCSGSQDVHHESGVACQGGTRLTDRPHDALQHGFEAMFDHRVAQATALVVCLQLGDGLAIIVKGVKVGEHHIPLDAAGIIRPEVAGVGVHAMHGSRDCFVRRGQENGIALGFAHLGPAIDPGKPAHGRDQGLRLGQHRGRPAG